MRLKQLYLRNYRRYKDPIHIHIGDITAFVGQNDAGKSSILEALNAFFSSDKGAVERDDLCKYADDATIEIGCAFDRFPADLIIDAEVKTRLADEHLLNNDGLLEIRKRWDFSKDRAKEAVIAICQHPTHPALADLLTQKIADLRKRAAEISVPAKEYDARVSSSIRSAIRNAIGVQDRKPTELPLNEGDLKDIWEQLKLWLPSYALFRADRPSTDSDDEFQDPMRIAVQSALQELQSNLVQIEQQVKARTIEVAKRTLRKLNEMNPDLARELDPRFESPKWSGVFKVGLTSDDQIPLNKRGSGTRRLILLNFFRAEAERLAAQRAQNQQFKPTTIYAIEEPETSQHPDHQVMLIRALKEIAETPRQQVLLTTHVPALAGMLSTDSIRHVVKVGRASNVLEGDGILDEVANTLGVLPNPVEPTRVIVLVEGPTDVKFLEMVSATLNRVDERYPSLAINPRVVLASLGGSTLKDWVQKH